MRPVHERREVKRLADAGLTASRIARLTGIPRSTVRDWATGRTAERSHDGCERCGHALHDFTALPVSEYAYLLGFYVGDGTISRHRRGVHALRIVNDSRYVGVITECAIAVAAVMPKNRVRFIQRAGCVELVATSKSWPCFFPQHGPGPKHRRRIELTEWQADIVGDRARAKSVRLLDAFVGPKA